MSERQVVPLLSVPLLLGGTGRPSANGGGFAVGLRPELVAGWLPRLGYAPRSGWGIGGYLDATTISGAIARETFVGGGATLAAYASRFGLAASAGADVPTSGGSTLPCLGAFVGLRAQNEIVGPADMPFGIRFDARLGPQTQQSYTVAVQIDPIVLSAAFVEAVFHYH
jgi:hypothetical protein